MKQLTVIVPRCQQEEIIRQLNSGNSGRPAEFVFTDVDQVSIGSSFVGGSVELKVQVSDSDLDSTVQAITRAVPFAKRQKTICMYVVDVQQLVIGE